MVDVLASDLRKHYYDPKLHGIDLDAKVREAKQGIDSAPSVDIAYTYVASVLEALDDSHTFFIPPPYPIKEDYGWRFQLFGDRCYVTHVRPGSDAEAKGLKPGDQLLTINGFTPDRAGWWGIKYVLNILMPMRFLNVGIRDQSNQLRQMKIEAHIRQTQQIMAVDDMTGRDTWRLRLDHDEELRLNRPRFQEPHPDLLIVKIAEFGETEMEVRDIIQKARKHKSLIVDLRGSPGGSEDTLQMLVGGLFESNIKIADRVSRDSSKPLFTKSDPHNTFAGKVIVIVDSSSGSAAELFARTIQVQKRGIVIGDRSAGKTMQSIYYPEVYGINPTYHYGAMITDADLILPDGKTLEKVGVMPDEIVLPTASDLASGRDPVMSRAAELAGVKITPEDAGKFFPFEWPSD
jgi:C-terminal processing protease CtpA/Prc